MTRKQHFRADARALTVFTVLVPLAVIRLAAQGYSYLPTASTTDERFLSLTGGNIQTLGDNPLIFKLASPDNTDSLEIGVFDGETGNMFDLGTVPLIYTLYADPEGDGTGTTTLGEWRGDSMMNNSWYTISVCNAPAARCECGDYFYLLKVRSADPNTLHWSNFKLRSNGTIAIARASNFTFSAPLGSLLDAGVVYPQYPILVPTTYDGSWSFYMDVPYAVSSLAIWDGDLDHGSYDCTANDDDDTDTPNSRPVWATGSAVAEGVASGALPCVNAAGDATGGTTTSNPPDNSRSAIYTRSPNIRYSVIAPNDVEYSNNNPSGNLEWEQFRISTAAFSRNMMDVNAGTLPAGSYEIAIDGMDLANLNALRFPYDVAGVDSDGNAVQPIRPDYRDGSITGTLYYESGGNCTQGLLEAGLPLGIVRLDADYNNDGAIDDTWRETSDLFGRFRFDGLHPGAYTITVEDITLPPGTKYVCDSDGPATPHAVRTTLTMCSRSASCMFGYRVSGLLGALSPSQKKSAPSLSTPLLSPPPPDHSPCKASETSSWQPIRC